MTAPLFRIDPALRTAPGRIVEVTSEGALVLDRSLFYPTGGGQPGDTGHLEWDGGQLLVQSTLKGAGDCITLVPAEGSRLPSVGAEVVQILDWDRRFRHMRMHTALHLLSVVVPNPVTGGQIGVERSRLDFDMAEPPEDRDALERALQALVSRDADVREAWITEAELDAQPDLVKTMSVQPPRGAGTIRLVEIADGAEVLDRQPCGGTHVARTGEIGTVRLGKVEKKGRQNRRIYLHLDD